ncbi:carbon-nitrogen hydrolase family protein [Silvanigrella aquatica]|uniref:CN hydrolase domain-containing protein n=1 Tax=Silvanigrella aquatica TaxID=1915309 RepID=A0A1L4CY11_9BACT|nr:carbon-nitrogen hydrolase family protein [Silvanigrella aquatica]APJ02842.1 hypothetical protein AXG55_02465 [Silvanigrella aquatica]
MEKKNSISIATAQFAAFAGNFGHNMKEMESLLEKAKAKNARLVVFPELSLSGYDEFLVSEGRCTIDITSKALNYFKNSCKKYEIYAVIGVCLQKNYGFSNSALVINNEGEIIGIYNKHYLDSYEKELFISGDSGFLFEIEGWKFSLAISSDAFYPEHAKTMAKGGAEVYLILGSFINGGLNHRRSLEFPARALENEIYVVVSNYIGSHGDMDFCGRSSIYAPNGDLLFEATADQKEIIVSLLEEREFIKQKGSVQNVEEQMEVIKF